MLKSKKQFHHSFNKCTFIIKEHSGFDTFYFGPGVYFRPSNCCVIAYVALGQKCLETPDLHDAIKQDGEISTLF